MSRGVAFAGALVLLLLAAPALADGFGWYARSFRYEAIGELFGAGRFAPETIERLQRQMHECVMSIYGDEAMADDDARTLGDMLRNGWKSNAGRRSDSNYFSAFVSVADCPGLLPEFAFAAQADMMAPSLFADALGKLPDPDRSVMSHFVKFGRAFGASESYVRCRDAQPNHAVQFDAPLTWCNPTHLILTPEEVKRLQAEVAAVLSVADENLRYYFQDFGRYVSAAAKEDRAILFQGFD